MSKLSAFLHPVTEKKEKEVVISDRFQDEKGNPIPFKIRSLSQEENESLMKKARRIRKTGQEEFNSAEYMRYLVVAATVEPDFSSKEVCDHFGVIDPSLVPGKMLLSGEYSLLVREITNLSGFNQDDIEGLAKN